MATLNIRGLDPGVHARIRVAARLRGILVHEYIERLVNLHLEMMERGQKVSRVGSLLRDVGLGPVRETE